MRSEVRLFPDPPLLRRELCFGASVAPEFTGRRFMANRARGCSSAGRAPALQAGGHRFDPGQLHHLAAQRKRQIRQERANGDGLALERVRVKVSLRLLFRSLTIWNDPSIEVEYGFDKRRTVFF